MSTSTTNAAGGPTPVRALMKLAPVERVVTRLADQGCDPREARENPGQWYARCPAHDDDDPSLAIGPTPDGKGARLHCHGHCAGADVLRALNLPVSVLSARGRRGARLDVEAAEREGVASRRSAALMADPDRLDELARFEGWTPEACEALSIGRHGRDHVSIPERDQFGRVVGVTLYAPRHRRRTGLTAMRSEAGGSRGMVYRPGQSAAPVLLVEGVSCAVAALSMGLDAVSMPSAKTGLRPAWASLFKRREVTIVPDADRLGREAAQRAAALLLPCCESVQVVELYPDAHGGEDVADLLREHAAAEAVHRLREAMDATEVMRRPKRGRRPTERQRVEDYLRDALADRACRDATEIFEGRPLNDAGKPISRRTYMEARKVVGVVAGRDGARTTVRLPRPRPQKSP